MADLNKAQKTSPVQVVVGLIKQRERILICERPEGKPYAGYWEFPGGKIESQETSLNALKRELLEELGIEVKRARLWLQHHHEYPDKRVQLNFWLVTEFEGTPLSKEGQQLLWASANDLQEKKLLEGNLCLLDQILKLLILG